MTHPTHHPAREILLDYTDGSLREPAALVIATHLALCPRCRQQVVELEAIGGAFLEEEELHPVSDDCLAALMARLDEPPAAMPRPCSPLPPADPVYLPEPLRSYVGAPLLTLNWRAIGEGIEEVDLRVGRPPVRTRLLRIAAGAALPHPECDGGALTLVLAGGCHDRNGWFWRGDVAFADTAAPPPVAEATEGCLCLTVTDAALCLTGGLPRYIAPHLRQ